MKRMNSKGNDKIMPFFIQITKNEAKFCEKIIRENVKKILFSG